MFPIHICKEKVIYFLSRANNVANVIQNINYLNVSAHNLVPQFNNNSMFRIYYGS